MIGCRRVILSFVVTFSLGCATDKPKKSEASALSQSEQSGASASNGRQSSDPSNASTAGAMLERAGSEEQIPKAKKLVLIVVDTLRADRLGCYGYKAQPTSPHIDKLASEGVLFEHFAVASPWTAPSFGTILTGLPPTIHRAGKILSKKSKAGQEVLGVRVSGLSKSVPTLGEMIPSLKRGAIMNNAFLHPALGFARGFDHYDHKNSSLLESRLASEVTQAAVGWLKENKDEDFFLLVHYFDPHISYDPPAKYKEMFAPGNAGLISAPFKDHYRARSGKLKPSEEEKAFIIGLYNGELRFVDDQIGELIAQMERLGLLDNTWIAVTSDHGEEQFDHGSFDHGHRYEEEVTRVPFILRAPKGRWNAGRRIPHLARHIDILPTILELYDVEAQKYLIGRSLLPLVDGRESSPRPAYMEYNLYWGQKYALYDGRYKFIANVYSGRGYLYDLLEDPGELKQLGKEHPQYAVLKKQGQMLRNSFAAQAKKQLDRDEAVELPEEVEEALRSLGYIQ